MISTRHLSARPIFLLLSAAIALISLAPFLLHALESSDTYLWLLSDDAFYYLITARNFVASGVSTFDGTSVTNGYHPLWFLVVSALVAVMGTGPAFFIALFLIGAAATFLTAWMLYSIAEELGASSIQAAAISLYATVFVTTLMFGGMEATIFIPSFAWLTKKLLVLLRTNEFSKWRLIEIGLIASCVVLARVDSILLIGLLILAVLFWNIPLAKKRFVLQWGLLGLTPLLLYILHNAVYFGTLLPISGEAKQLASGWGLNRYVLEKAIVPRRGLLPLLAIGFSFAILLGTRIHARYRGVLLAILGYMLLYFSLYAVLSDWILFGWYYAIAVVPVMVAATLVVRFFAARSARLATMVDIAVVLICLEQLITFAVRTHRTSNELSNPNPNSAYAHTKVLQHFVAEHPGNYAMGDRAGITAYLTGKPLVQLEGLVNDRRLLRMIDREESLLTAFDSLKVDYYITSLLDTPLTKTAGCYEVEEPHRTQAGWRSKKMRASLCGEPVFTYAISDSTQAWLRSIGQFQNHAFTYIFKVH